MSKSTNIVLLVSALLITISGLYLFYTPRPAVPSSSDTSGKTQQMPSMQDSSTAPMSATVEYTANGFSLDTVTIKQGGVVTFVSVDETPMWVASNAHPTHLQYDGTSRTQHCPNIALTAFDQCTSGESYSFTFLKVGNWNYHNHLNADDDGTIIVVQ